MTEKNQKETTITTNGFFPPAPRSLLIWSHLWLLIFFCRILKKLKQIFRRLLAPFQCMNPPTPQC